MDLLARKLIVKTAPWTNVRSFNYRQIAIKQHTQKSWSNYTNEKKVRLRIVLSKLPQNLLRVMIFFRQSKSIFYAAPWKAPQGYDCKVSDFLRVRFWATAKPSGLTFFVIFFVFRMWETRNRGKKEMSLCWTSTSLILQQQRSVDWGPNLASPARPIDRNKNDFLYE